MDNRHNIDRVSWQEARYRMVGGCSQGGWERHVPQLTSHWIHLFHIARYRYASDHIQSSDSVLDIGCGVGYGSAVLACKAKSVVGVDINVDAIDSARSHYAYPNIDFLAGDWTEVLSKELYSFIVAFEFLEHILEQESFVESAAASLVDGGQLFVSTPNRIISRGGNPYHLRELSLDEFRSLLANHFESVQIVGQYIKHEFFDRQSRLFDYIDSQHFVGFLQRHLPSFLQGRLKTRAYFLRRELEQEFAGLQLEDVLFSGGDEVLEKSFMFVARCR